MPDYSKLEELMSHRVRIDYDTGARIVGYLASCKPAGGGQVQFVTIAKAELVLSDGTVAEQFDELTVPANVMVAFRRDEGPRGRDRQAG
jgi:hypothetical protein